MRSIKLILILFVCLIYYSQVRSQIIFEKNFSGDSLRFCIPGSSPHPIENINDNLFLIYNGSGPNQFINSGLLNIDLAANILLRKEFLINRSFQVENIIPKEFKYQIYSKFDPTSQTPGTAVYYYPHIFIVDNNFNVLSEYYDSTNFSWRASSKGGVFTQYVNDSLYCERAVTYKDTTDDGTPFTSFYDAIIVMDNMTLPIREIIPENFRHDKNIWESEQVVEFLLSESNEFYIAMKKRNSVKYWDESSIIKLNYEGKILWTKDIRYKDKRTEIKSGLLTPQGDLVFYGYTLPNLPDSEIPKADTLETQIDSLFIVKVNGDGNVLWMKEHPLPRKTYFEFNFNSIRGGKYFALFDYYIKDNDFAKYKKQNCLYLLNSEGDICYSKIWTTVDTLSNAISGLAEGGDNLFLLGSSYNSSVKNPIKIMTLTCLNPEITDIKDNKVESNDLILFPNPVDDYLRISGFERDYSSRIRIYSTQGLKLIDTEYQGKIDTGNLAPGLYILQIGIKIKKFVKL